MAVNELLKRPFTKRELLPFVASGEQVADGAWHLDNVAPSLLGGMVLIRDNETCDVHRLITPVGLRVCVVHPDLQVLTKDSRAILSDSVPLVDMVRQQSNLAGFIVGLYRGDLELVGRSMRDLVIEPQRARLIPHFELIQSTAFSLGALGCSISGAGPSVFAFCSNELIAEKCGAAIQRIWQDHGIDSTVFQSGINPEGARVC
jgi:homoserine kinase